jgi:hypothetical protein
VLYQPQLVVIGHIGQFGVDIYLTRSYNPVHSRYWVKSNSEIEGDPHAREPAGPLSAGFIGQ